MAECPVLGVERTKFTAVRISMFGQNRPIGAAYANFCLPTEADFRSVDHVGPRMTRLRHSGMADLPSSATYDFAHKLPLRGNFLNDCKCVLRRLAAIAT